ncbi:MAG TPA: hypothetical protein PLE72_03605 [Azospira sp.]|nr:hypothetical protein [Azospira sp.]HNN07855.1 hypothetical protein [Azospira sp.]HNN45854.1 hypothetical protein [Azospira sp.]
MSITEPHDAFENRCKNCGISLPINQACPYCKEQGRALESTPSEASPELEQKNTFPPLITFIFAALIGFVLHPLLGIILVVVAIARAKGIGKLFLVLLIIFLAFVGFISSFGHGFFGK